MLKLGVLDSVEQNILMLADMWCLMDTVRLIISGEMHILHLVVLKRLRTRGVRRPQIVTLQVRLPRRRSTDMKLTNITADTDYDILTFNKRFSYYLLNTVVKPQHGTSTDTSGGKASCGLR
jgi:hypothetical protein